MKRADILRAQYMRAWQNDEPAAIGDLFHPDAAASGLVPGLPLGAEEFRRLIAAIQDLVEPPRITIEETVEQGDWLAGFACMHTRRIDRHQDLNVGGMVIARFDGPAIVEAYNSFDFITFFEELGLLPDNTAAPCLTGRRRA